MGNSKATKTVRPRIGIYAGTFDPVHTGHVAFALQALAEARLDEVIFLPERRPRHKPGVEHYAHRVAMLQRALGPHPALAVMETVDRHFTIKRTLPLLRHTYPDAQLVFLMGSDVIHVLPSWPYAARLLSTSELAIGVRSTHELQVVDAEIRDWQQLPQAFQMIEGIASDVSSSLVRQALRADEPGRGVLASVRRYARQEWLYVSPGGVSR